MTSEINRKCPYCGHNLVMDSYKMSRGIETIAYCDNDKCPVQPCTDSTTPSKVYVEILAITGDKK